MLGISNFADKNQASIAQQLDTRTHKQSLRNSQATPSLKGKIATKNNTQYKEKQDQIKQFTS